MKKGKPQALEGVKIIDLTYLYPGGICTRFLADHGAQVIRVERPGNLYDQTQIWPWGEDSPSLARRAMAARYFQISCNKESIELDYTCPKGRSIFINLIRQSDVLVEGFRPGVMERYGLGYPQLKKVNSQLIYCSITGYGQEGPYAKLPSHDPNIQALSGVMALTQGPIGPGLPGIPIGDILAGNNSAIAILMALLGRYKGNVGGQHIDVSMLDSVVWAMGLSRADAYFATGQYLGANRWPLHIFRTMDKKYICLIALEKKFWRTLCSRLGINEYAEEWTTVLPFSKDTPKRREILAKLVKIFKTKTREDWFRYLSDCCLTPVLEFEEVLNDTNTVAHNLFVYIEDPKLGPVPCLGVPFRMSRTSGQINRLPPLKGEHTRKILSDLGYKEDRMERNRNSHEVG
jgi:crotonobetainyl-CoA:carnitine CoA-transferase CaiB-like acyl-CoA transferase